MAIDTIYIFSYSYSSVAVKVRLSYSGCLEFAEHIIRRSKTPKMNLGMLLAIVLLICRVA